MTWKRELLGRYEACTFHEGGFARLAAHERL